SVRVMVLSKPGMGIFLGTEPVATIISSKPPRVLMSLISVLTRTSMPVRAISFLYHSMSCLSFSLKDMEEAVMNRPPRRSVFSKMTGLWPRRFSTRAHSMPPMPPPITATFLGLVVGTIVYLLCCIVGGVRAQRARCMESHRGCRLFVPLYLAMLKQPL